MIRLRSMQQKLIQISILLFVVLMLASCGSGGEDKSLVAPEGMNVLHLSKYGKPFDILIPDTTKARLSIVEQSSGALEIKVGENFGIAINEQAIDLSLAKSDIADDEINKLKSYFVDEPAAMFWESEIVRPEFHFYVNHKIGEAEYSVEDIREPEANAFSKEDVQKMFDCAKSVKQTALSEN